MSYFSLAIRKSQTIICGDIVLDRFHTYMLRNLTCVSCTLTYPANIIQITQYKPLFCTHFMSNLPSPANIWLLLVKLFT